MKLTELFDPDKLTWHIGQKNIRVQRHPTLPLSIVNYTQQAQFGRVWDEVTTNCRGLVFDDEGFVCARPWPKFFNLNTSYRPESLAENLPTGKPVVSEKMDGFLVIGFNYKGQDVLASRGSFTSEHSQWATNWWVEHVGGCSCVGALADEVPYYAKRGTDALGAGLTTYLFEGLCADLRIVVKYPEDKLVLLALVDNSTGAEYPAETLNQYARYLRVEQVPIYDKSVADIEADIKADLEKGTEREGYVLSWPNPTGPSLKLKVKYNQYLRLHRLLTGVSPKHIWEALKSGAGLADFLADAPLDFQQWVEGWSRRLYKAYDKHDTEVRRTVAEALLEQGLVGTTPLYPTGQCDSQFLNSQGWRVKYDRERRAKFAAYVKGSLPTHLHGGAFTLLFYSLGDYKDWLWDSIQSETAGETYRRDAE